MFSTLSMTVAVVVLLSAAMMPGTFRVQRTRIIHAGPRKIAPLIEDLDAWQSWSPYARSGAGRMEIRLEPRSGSTDVTWTMYGRSPYLARVATTFFVGSQFETGLANLKAIAEG